MAVNISGIKGKLLKRAEELKKKKGLDVKPKEDLEIELDDSVPKSKATRKVPLAAKDLEEEQKKKAAQEYKSNVRSQKAKDKVEIASEDEALENQIIERLRNRQSMTRLTALFSIRKLTPRLVNVILREVDDRMVWTEFAKVPGVEPYFEELIEVFRKVSKDRAGGMFPVGIPEEVQKNALYDDRFIYEDIKNGYSKIEWAVKPTTNQQVIDNIADLIFDMKAPVTLEDVLKMKRISIEKLYQVVKRIQDEKLDPPFMAQNLFDSLPEKVTMQNWACTILIWAFLTQILHQAKIGFDALQAYRTKLIAALGEVK